MDGVEDQGRNWEFLTRVAIGGAILFASLFGVLLFLGWEPQVASELAFSLPALPFSIGLIGWATILLSGNAMEGFSRHAGFSPGFSKEGGRQAMAILIAFGAGGMVGASLAAAPYGA